MPDDEDWLAGYRAVEARIDRDNATGRWISAYLALTGLIVAAVGDAGYAVACLLLIAVIDLGSIWEHRSRRKRAFAEALRQRATRQAAIADRENQRARTRQALDAWDAERRSRPTDFSD
jgi:hypothetical protein